MFSFCLVFKIPIVINWPNTVAAGGLGPLSSQTQEIITVGLSEIGMANPMWGERKESVFFFFFKHQLSLAMTKEGW